MLGIGQEKHTHRVLLAKRRRHSSSLPRSSLNDGLLLQSFSYCKLPLQLLKLSVLKLDGSTFDVHVSKNATVAELKEAIEEVFSSSAREEDQGKISWSNVWGHFCLCFEGQKLINNKAYIRNFGIKDGDQLRFIQHMSINYEPPRRSSKNLTVSCKQSLMFSSGSDDHEDEEQTSTNDNDDREDQQDSYKEIHNEDEEAIQVPEFKLAHFLKGWMSYSRLRSIKRKGYEGKRLRLRFALHCLGDGSRMEQCSFKNN